jgi:hypothetical protein
MWPLLYRAQGRHAAVLFRPRLGASTGTPGYAQRPRPIFAFEGVTPCIAGQNLAAVIHFAGLQQALGIAGGGG